MTKAKPRKGFDIMKAVIIGILLVFLSGTTGLAAPVSFFGEDLGKGDQDQDRLSAFPNADAARDAFFSNLVGVGTETFEGSVIGASVVNVNFDVAGTATLIGVDGRINEAAYGTTNAGRYPISGTKYWESYGDFRIEFSGPVSAFGFYGIDIGEEFFQGRVSLRYENDQDGFSETLSIATTSPAGGNVIYFGFYDLEQEFTRVVFDASDESIGADVFGFDDFSVGAKTQVAPSPVPLPTTAALFALGIPGLLLLRRRIRWA